MQSTPPGLHLSFPGAFRALLLWIGGHRMALIFKKKKRKKKKKKKKKKKFGISLSFGNGRHKTKITKSGLSVANLLQSLIQFASGRILICGGNYKEKEKKKKKKEKKKELKKAR
jgi:hypothetical protein